VADRRWSHREFRGHFTEIAVLRNAKERLYAVEGACLTMKFCFIAHRYYRE
jgi:hypothetical protein